MTNGVWNTRGGVAPAEHIRGRNCRGIHWFGMTRMVGEGGREWKRVMNSGREGKKGASHARTLARTTNRVTCLFFWLCLSCRRLFTPTATQLCTSPTPITIPTTARQVTRQWGSWRQQGQPRGPQPQRSDDNTTAAMTRLMTTAQRQRTKRTAQRQQQ